MRVFFAALLLVFARIPASAAVTSGDPAWVWPLGSHAITRNFDPPQSAYGAGHRGIDLPGRPGELVRSVAGGTVTFAGQVGGVPTIAVTHGVERSTYQPVQASVRLGDSVTAGETIGTLVGTTLNLGRLAGDTYRDPAELLSAAHRVRLISPNGPPPAPPRWASGNANLVGGVVTSGFGWRIHPISGKRSFHDGVDLGVACGTPVPALTAGRVTFSGNRGAFGTYIEIDHGNGTSSGYAHLSRAIARVGEHVTNRQIIGMVGTTGNSTGCHLHLRVLKDGVPTDPLG